MFVKYHLGLSYILSPTEARFIMHMVEIHHMTLWGFKTDFTRAEYMRRMGLREHAFDSAAKSLTRMGLVRRRSESSRNRVHYSLDTTVYDRLVVIVSATRNIDRLIGFIDFNIRKLGKSIASITDEEIEGIEKMEFAE